MSLFTRSLWPETVRTPYRRLIAGLVISPLVLVAVLTLTAFVLAGMSERNFGVVVAVTIDAGTALGALVVMYTLTFGLLGIGLLWWLGQRGLGAWLTTGLLCGGVAGVLFGVLAMEDFGHMLIVVFAASGAALNGMVRLIAGIQEDKRGD